MSAKQYRDMTDDERLAWGLTESGLRQLDLAGVKDAEALKRAQDNAKARRGLIGASRSAASDMVVVANRHLRRGAA